MDDLARYNLEALEQVEAAAPQPPPSSKGAIGVLPIRGPISQRANLFTMIFGGATAEAISQQMRQMISDPNIKAIVMDIDSPGGSVAGMTELAAEIRDMRGSKPLVAVANSLMASAAYWLGSQADEVVVSPSGLMGSIGVFSLHLDMSKAMEQEGVKPTFIQFGENKTAGNPLEPLSDAARGEMQRIVDAAGHDFVRDVANGRKVTQATVMEDFGQGLMFTAKEAVRRGLADREATLSDVLADLGMQASRSNRRAELRREVQRASLA